MSGWGLFLRLAAAIESGKTEGAAMSDGRNTEIDYYVLWQRSERDLAVARRSLEEARGLLERCAAGLGPCPLQRQAFAFLDPPAATPPPCDYTRDCPTCRRPMFAVTVDRPMPPPGFTAAQLTAAINFPGDMDAEEQAKAGAPRNPEKPCATCEGDKFVHDDNDASDELAEKPCPTCTPGAKP